MSENRWGRREFLRLCSQVGGLLGLVETPEVVGANQTTGVSEGAAGTSAELQRLHGCYSGSTLDEIAFPLGGIGAGMICLEGGGAISRISLHNRPNLAFAPRVFGAISILGPTPIALVLEGPVPVWKVRPAFENDTSAVGGHEGVPRFARASFRASFPFATVSLADPQVPLETDITAWSPFCPGDADSSSLPVSGLEYRFVNRTAASVEAVFSFNAENFMAEARDRMEFVFARPQVLNRITSTKGGFVLSGRAAQNSAWPNGDCAIWTDDPNAQVNHAWFSGPPEESSVGSLQILWSDIETGRMTSRAPMTHDSAPGASIFVPFKLNAGEEKAIRVKISWYVPHSNVFQPDITVTKKGTFRPITESKETYQPWYASQFKDIHDVVNYWDAHYISLREASVAFTRTFYDSTLPPEVMDTIVSGLCILKSPTVLRQTDGRIWGWEGSNDSSGGGGFGSCTHVWNYAQVLPHLFPELERGLRETEFGPCQNAAGFQVHRAPLPIRALRERDVLLDMPAAADGQLGGIIKVYREWRICGDTEWMRKWWPRIRASLEYCIRTWDPHEIGAIEEPHLTTYDAELWGPECMCTGMYVGALKAACLMGAAADDDVARYSGLLRKAIQRMEEDLFNGAYFIQKEEWRNLRSPMRDSWEKNHPESPDGLAVRLREGPEYQFGQGCLSSGLLGSWLSTVCGLPDMLDKQKVRSHLFSVYRHNLRRPLGNYPNLWKPCLGYGDESGIVVCTWPRGGRPTRPLQYAEETWTGIEYQVASQLISLGCVKEGLEIIRASRDRYDGRVRNPFDNVESGHWYARAMSSYALLQAFSGARFDAVEKILYLQPSIRGDFRSFLSTATGFGTVGVRDGRPFVNVVSGSIPYTKIEYTPA